MIYIECNIHIYCTDKKNIYISVPQSFAKQQHITWYGKHLWGYLSF